MLDSMVERNGYSRADAAVFWGVIFYGTPAAVRAVADALTRLDCEEVNT